MNCTEAQDLLLEELETPVDAATQGKLQRHLEECETCRTFEALHRQIDVALRAGAPALVLGADFRRALEERLAVEQTWPEWLPELAYVVGAALATGACILALPFPVANTWWIGGAMAGVGLFAHALVARALCLLDAPAGG